MKSQKKYYGILMNRQTLGQEIYVLQPKSVISGTLHKSGTQVKFADEMNRNYFLSDDASTIFYELQDSIMYLITEEKLLEKYQNCSLEDAKNKYLEEIQRSLHFYTKAGIKGSKIKILSIELEEILSQKQIFAPSLDEKIDAEEEPSDKIALSRLLETNNGDEIIAITTSELLSIIGLETFDEMKKKLQKLYDDTIELNQYFLSLEEKSSSSLDDISNLCGTNIVKFFNAVCDELESCTTIGSVQQFIIKVESTWFKINDILDKRRMDDDSDIEAASDFLYRLIDCFADLGKSNDLAAIKRDVKKIRENERKNIIRLGEIYDKYDIRYLESSKTTRTIVINNKPSTILKAREIKQYLDRKIVGQEEAKKDVISALVMNSLSDDYKDKNSCLLVGPTGSGKTLIVTTIAEYLEKPAIIVDTPQITIEGYVGKNIEDELVKLIDAAGGDQRKAEEGIICFDEIDKKGSEKNSDPSGRGVLNLLLNFIQGTTYDVKYNNQSIRFDTSRLTIFATGSFDAAVRKLASEDKGGLGFGAYVKTKEEREGSKYPKLTPEHLIKYGEVPAELVGRFSTITQLSEHTYESLKQILLLCETSALLAEQSKLAKLGVQLKWTEGYIDALTRYALQLKTGARSLKQAVEQSVKEVRWTVISSIGEYSCVILNQRTVEDNMDCLLIDNYGTYHNLKDLLKSEQESTIKQKQIGSMN